MAYLSLSLLGPFQAWTSNGSLQLFRTLKERALLSYLVVENSRAQRRDSLAALFWPDRPEGVARNNLRQALYGIRQAIGGTEFDAIFTVTSDDILVNINEQLWLDLAAYDIHRKASQIHNHDLTGPCPYCMQHLRDAVEIYRGSFLEDVDLENNEPFQEWVTEKRETYRLLQIHSLEYLTYEYERMGDFSQAAVYAIMQARLDVLREAGYRRLITLLARAGRRGTALEWYETYRRKLAELPGQVVSPEMAELAEQVLQGRFDPGISDIYPTFHNLPEYLTPFVGRESELTRISNALESSGCRLVTIAGLGGAGKTLLAVQAARLALRSFQDGVFFVALETIPTSDLLIDTIGRTIGLVPGPQQEMRSALLGYLRLKHILIVLDNFEHLLDAKGVLLEILQAAPFVKILLTTRELLNVQAETLISLNGLPFPSPTAAEPDGQETRLLPETYAAVRLFFERVARVLPQMQNSGAPNKLARPLAYLEPEELDAVVRICRLVDGLPLGIELAASLTRDYSFEQIAEEVQRSLDFLQSSLQDLPPRHRSLRVSFEHSWDLLPDDEREVFTRLAVFPSSFTGTAAQAIAGAAMPWLMRLEDRSLARRVAQGRYDLHPLIREYALQKLHQFSRRIEDQAQMQHATYFCNFLSSRRAAFTGQGQVAALEEVQADLENIFAAWDWAAEHNAYELLEKAAFGMMYFLEARSRWNEGVSHFRRAADRLQEAADGPARAHIFGFVLACQGWFCCRLSNFDEAETLLLKGLSLLNGAGVERERAFAHFALGFLYVWMTRFQEAQLHLTTSLSQSEAVNDLWGAAWARELLAEIAFESGQSGNNDEPFLKTLSLFEKIGDMRGSSRALNYLGNISVTRGQYAPARVFFERMLAMAEKVGDVWGAAGSYSKLGMLAMANGEPGQAWRLYHRSLLMFQRMGDQRRSAYTMRELGEAAHAFGRQKEAVEQFGHALEIASRLRSEALAQDILLGIAAVLLQGTQKTRAVELVCLVLARPVGDQITSSRANQLMANARTITSAVELEQGMQAASARTLWDAVDQYLQEGVQL